MAAPLWTLLARWSPPRRRMALAAEGLPVTNRKVGRQKAAADAPEDTQEAPAGEVDDRDAQIAELKRALKAFEAKDKESTEAKKKAERAALSELERVTAERDEWKAAAETATGELGSLRKGMRASAFQDEVAKLAPGVPPKRLRALLKDLESDGFDIAPEQASPSQAKKALEKLKENDPDSFTPAKGPNIPGPGATRTPEPGPIDWRQRGAQVAGRGRSKKPATTTKKSRKKK